MRNGVYPFNGDRVTCEDNQILVYLSIESSQDDTGKNGVFLEPQCETEDNEAHDLRISPMDSVNLIEQFTFRSGKINQSLGDSNTLLLGLGMC